MANIIEQSSWATAPGVWNGEWQGASAGAHICVIFNVMEEIGAGPRLHRHPYSETFIIRAGRALFTIGSEEVVALPGQILVVPANTPHKFSNLGPDALETIDIHANGRFVTEWLE